MKYARLVLVVSLFSILSVSLDARELSPSLIPSTWSEADFQQLLTPGNIHDYHPYELSNIGLEQIHGCYRLSAGLGNRESTPRVECRVPLTFINQSAKGQCTLEEVEVNVNLVLQGTFEAIVSKVIGYRRALANAGSEAVSTHLIRASSLDLAHQILSHYNDIPGGRLALAGFGNNRMDPFIVAGSLLLTGRAFTPSLERQLTKTAQEAMDYFLIKLKKEVRKRYGIASIRGVIRLGDTVGTFNIHDDKLIQRFPTIKEDLERIFKPDFDMLKRHGVFDVLKLYRSSYVTFMENVSLAAKPQFC